MSGLRVFLLGPPRIERDGAPIEFGTRKAIALLAYLAVARHSHSRETLAALLWPEHDQAHARAALRSTLWALNKALAGAGLDIERETIGLERNADPSSGSGQALWLDVDRFHDRLAECHTHGHPADDVCHTCLPSLAEAAALYRDDFLAGFTLRDSPDFEEWRFFQAESLRRELASALERLARGHSLRREFEATIAYVRRWLALDPLHEPAHWRLMLVYAWAGQRAAALRQYQECVQLLERELGAPPQEETVQLYEAIKENREPPPPVAPLPPDQPLSGNLAAHRQPTPFVGREAELAEIARLLENPNCRLLTIVGPGGIGKTRLALQSAIEHSAAFSHGVYFVPLAPVSSTEILVPTIAESLAFQFFGKQDPKTQLINYLRAKNMLLVMDNFEHLVERVGLLTNILESAPDVKVLVTSRERLNHPREWQLDIQGLTFPEEATHGAEVESYSAVQLFIHSARRVHWGFALSEAERPGVARVCRLVEGMPLGVELAAAWVRVISCAEIAQEIERDLGFLATTLGGMPERHRSLRAVFDYSWKRLPEEERSVFRKLSVFRGGFGRDAAERVAGASLVNLSTLVDHSFLHRTPSGRYEAHELLRQYAEAELQTSPQESEETHDRHCAYYADFLQQREAHLKGAGQREALEVIGKEIENVRAGWRWAAAREKVEATEKSIESLYLFFRITSRFREGIGAFGAAAEALGGTEHGVLLGEVLARQGVFAELLGEFDQARELLQGGLTILQSRPRKARRAIAFSFHELGVIAYRQGKYVEAKQLLPESVALYRALNDAYETAEVLTHQGMLASELGEYGEAKQALQESLSISREIGDKYGMAATLNTLGILAARREGYAESKQLFQAGLAIRREMGDRYGVASSLSNLGYLANIQREYTEAKQLTLDSLAIRREIGDQYTIAICLHSLGDLAYNLGEYEQAKQYAQESLALRREIGDRRGIAIALNVLGTVAAGLGDHQESRRSFHDALDIGMDLRVTPLVLDVLARLADLLLKEGKAERAMELLAFALQHPTAEKETKDRALRLLAELESQLLPQVMVAAQERGKARKLEEVVEEILGESEAGEIE